ncbi:MAG TPA: alpha/beta hydrolase [Chloroflexia bacterium]|nr:alpha/beta hydrolase [Chloroflexia bacterium]
MNETVLEPRTEFVEVEGGRRVAVYRLAEGDSGRVVVLCHIAPGSGTLDPDPEQTLARGVTLLAVDRPGYGRSDPLPDSRWATVSSAADDLAAVLDRLGGAPVGVAGWSAGGRVALALAARRPDLVDRVVVIGTPAPHEEVPWIPDEEQAMLDAMRGLPPEAVHATMKEQFGAMLAQFPSPGDALGLLGVSPADDAALARPGVRERLAAMLDATLAQGAAGMVADVAGYTLQPWGFEPEAVKAKTLLLYGSDDPVAGPRHAQWWKKHIPDSRVEIAPGAGHMLVFPLWERVLSHLAPGAKRRT